MWSRIGVVSAGAVDGDFWVRGAMVGAGELAPGVTVALKVSAAVGRIRIQINRGARAEGADRDHVPRPGGDDVSDEEIDFLRGIGFAGASGAAVLGLNVITMTAADHSLGGFDLHAPEMAAGIEDEVVRFGFAVRLGDHEAEIGGVVHEGEFGDLSATLGGVKTPT